MDNKKMYEIKKTAIDESVAAIDQLIMNTDDEDRILGLSHVKTVLQREKAIARHQHLGTPLPIETLIKKGDQL